MLWTYPEAYSETCQASGDGAHCKTSRQHLTVNIFTKCYILDLWQASEYGSTCSPKTRVTITNQWKLWNGSLMFAYFSSLSMYLNSSSKFILF